MNPNSFPLSQSPFRALPSHPVVIAWLQLRSAAVKCDRGKTEAGGRQRGRAESCPDGWERLPITPSGEKKESLCSTKFELSHHCAVSTEFIFFPSCVPFFSSSFCFHKTTFAFLRLWQTENQLLSFSLSFYWTCIALCCLFFLIVFLSISISLSVPFCPSSALPHSHAWCAAVWWGRRTCYQCVRHEAHCQARGGMFLSKCSLDCSLVPVTVWDYKSMVYWSYAIEDLENCAGLMMHAWWLHVMCCDMTCTYTLFSVRF